MKHGVRRAEQAAEDDEQRERQRATERDSAYLPQPPGGQLAPGHVTAEQREYTDPRTHGGVAAGPHEVPGLATAQPHPLDAQEGDREEDDEADRVECLEGARVARDEVRADEQGRSREPGGFW